MEDFLEFIDAEIFLQRILAKKSKQTLKRCPEGSLCSKQRKGKVFGSLISQIRKT